MNGMQGMEFIPVGKLLRFLEDSDMKNVYLHDNTVHSLPYNDMEISGSKDQTVKYSHAINKPCHA